MEMKNEMLILRKSRAFWIVVLGIALISVIVVFKSAASFLSGSFFATDYPDYLGRTCSQIVFPALFLCASLLATVIGVKAFLDVAIDRRRGVLQQKRVLTPAWKIAVRYAITLGVQICVAFVMALLLGLLAQIVANHMWPEYSRELLLHHDAVKTVILFFLSVLLATETIGLAAMALALFIKNMVLGVGIVYVLSALVFVRTYVIRGTFSIYAKEAACFVMSDTEPVTAVPEWGLWVMEAVTVVCLLIVFCVTMNTKRMGYEA